MRKTRLPILLFVIIISYISCQKKFDNLKNDWQPTHIPNLDGFVSKHVGTIKYTMNPSRSIEEREAIIAETEKYITECLEIVGESDFNDSLHIALVHNLDEAEKYFGRSVAGMTSLRQDDLIEELPQYKDTPFISENSIRSIYVHGSNYNPLKHEIMHIIMFLKWGYETIEPHWLVEGIPTFVGSEYYNCDGLTLQERYAYLLQNNKLLGVEGLMRFPREGSESFISGKAAYTQSGYLIEYLYENYGIEKIKTLWIDSGKAFRSTNNSLPNFFPVFEQVYHISMEEMIEKINEEIRNKYPNTIDLSWEDFSKQCVE